MEQHLLPFLRPTPKSQWEYLYRYFEEAEEKQIAVTSVKIQQAWLAATGEMRDLDAIRWYMYRYWRWFLFLEDSRVKPYRYTVKHIKGYPPDYFVQAHMDASRMQYLVHFVRSIETDKELRKLAMGRGPKRPRSAFPMQQPPDTDDQQQIPVDNHEEEEGNIPDIDFPPEGQGAVSSPVIDVVDRTGEGASLDTRDTNAQNEAGGDNEVELPFPNPPPFDTPDPPQSNSLPLWSRVKSAIIDHKKEVSWAVGISLIVCAIAVYFFVRH